MDFDARISALGRALPKARKEGALDTIVVECDEIEKAILVGLARLFTLRARVSDSLGRPNEQMDFLKKAIAADPTSRAAYYGLMTAQAKKNDLDGLLYNAGKLVELDGKTDEKPFTDIAIAFLAYGCWRKGRIPDALKYMELIRNVDGVTPLIGTGTTVAELRNELLPE